MKLIKCTLIIFVLGVIASCEYMSVLPTQGYNAGYPHSVTVDENGSECVIESRDHILPQYMVVQLGEHEMPFENNGQEYRYEWLTIVLDGEEKVIRITATPNFSLESRQLSVRGMCLDRGMYITVNQTGRLLAPGESQIISYR